MPVSSSSKHVCKIKTGYPFYPVPVIENAHIIDMPEKTPPNKSLLSTRWSHSLWTVRDWLYCSGTEKSEVRAQWNSSQTHL